MFANIGWFEISIIALVALVLFGGSQLPKFGGHLGKSSKEIKKAGKELSEAITESKKS